MAALPVDSRPTADGLRNNAGDCGEADGRAGESRSPESGDKAGAGAGDKAGRGAGRGARPGRPLLVVAADMPGADQALELAGRLQGLPLWLKVGLELFTAAGPPLLERLAACRLPVFLDLKFHDIPNTVRGAVRSAAGLDVRMLTLHAGGGAAMCRAAVAGREEARDVWRERNRQGENAPWPLLMGVTVLTSEAGDPEAIRRLVVQRALLARESGLDGVVCSGLEAAAVKEACGAEFLCLCPGIRFAGHAGGDDQSRVSTPAMAARAGADFLVMGRPITGAPDPAQAARTALTELGYGSDFFGDAR